MFGINEIINKLINKRQLTEKERFKILHSKRIDLKVVEYLISRLSNLYIEVLGEYEGTLFQLMPFGKLEGWCWQTTESAIIFFNDSDYIERGYLKFTEGKPKYYHSWICFKFNEIEYVLDPCLSFLCKKKDYSRIFETEVKGIVSAKAVREELIKQVTTLKDEDNSLVHESFQTFLKNYLGKYYESYEKSKRGEVVVDGSEDVDAPLYRNGSGYKTEFENGKIQKLTVHYYDTNY